jgi:hypothetical protein
MLLSKMYVLFLNQNDELPTAPSDEIREVDDTRIIIY